MSVKKFVAADMRRALELVKQEMGTDAIILSTNRVKEGVEIVTSDDAQHLKVSKPSAFSGLFSSSQPMVKSAETIKSVTTPSANYRSTHSEPASVKQTTDYSQQAKRNPHSHAISNPLSDQEKNAHTFKDVEDDILAGNLSQSSNASLEKTLENDPIVAKRESQDTVEEKNTSLLDRFRQKKSQKKKQSHQEKTHSAMDYYNDKANDEMFSFSALDDPRIEKKSDNANGGLHLASLQLSNLEYSTANASVKFDLDEKYYVTQPKPNKELQEELKQELKQERQSTHSVSRFQRREDMFSRSDVDEILSEQFATLKSEISEMRELLRQQMLQKHSLERGALEKDTLEQDGLEQETDIAFMDQYRSASQRYFSSVEYN